MKGGDGMVLSDEEVSRRLRWTNTMEDLTGRREEHKTDAGSRR